jgi:HSP20 family molecular chaperone IbpA
MNGREIFEFPARASKFSTIRNQGGGAMATRATATSLSRIPQPVQVVEADVFDRMNETREDIAQRAYEIYQSRGGGHGADRDDWLQAEGELLPKIEVDFKMTDDIAQLTAQIPGFDASDLEVAVGHRRAVICGIHPDSKRPASGGESKKKVMRVVELPFDVNPDAAEAMLQAGTLRILLPKSE